MTCTSTSVSLWRALAGVLLVAAPSLHAEQACVDRDDVFLFEDTNETLTPSGRASFSLMGDAFTALKDQYGDQYDFIFYSYTVGGINGYHKFVFNDTQGIGRGPFDLRSSFGSGTDKVQGLIHLGTMTALATPEILMTHELMHRWSMFLPPLADGRRFQGGLTTCGATAHYNWALDIGGDTQSGSIWTGENPATRQVSSTNIYTDGYISPLGLYVGGFITATELDDLVTNKRYMDDLADDCLSNTYSGPISTWDSADIIETAGQRVPSVQDSQKDFRCAWILLYQPDELGTPALETEIDYTVSSMQAFQDSWASSTLGRSTVNFQLELDLNCNGVPDDIDAKCRCDFDDSGQIDFFDLLDYLDAWFAGNPAAEFDDVGGVDFFDLLAFLECWFADEDTGCTGDVPLAF